MITTIYMNFLLKLLKLNQRNKQNFSWRLQSPWVVGWINMTNSRLWSFKASLCWGQLNHTKNNQPNYTRKLGWVPYSYKANIKFPWKIRVGTEETKSDDLGIQWAKANGNSWLKLLCMILQVQLTILLVFCFSRSLFLVLPNLWPSQW